MIAIIKLILFLRIANFNPISLISSGKVIKPIIVKVVIKAATAPIAAPSFIKEADNGKAKIAGICKIEPKNDAVNKPLIPAPSPIRLDIKLSGIKVNNNPIKTTIESTVGRILINEIATIFNDANVFFLFFINEINRHKITNTLILIAVIDISDASNQVADIFLYSSKNLFRLATFTCIAFDHSFNVLLPD